MKLQEKSSAWHRTAFFLGKVFRCFIILLLCLALTYSAAVLYSYLMREMYLRFEFTSIFGEKYGVIANYIVYSQYTVYFAGGLMVLFIARLGMQKSTKHLVRVSVCIATFILIISARVLWVPFSIEQEKRFCFWYMSLLQNCKNCFKKQKRLQEMVVSP